MKTRWSSLVYATGLVIGLPIVAAAWVSGDAKNAKAADIPAAAKKALEEIAGGAAIREFETEMENGVAVYEAEWSAGGTEHEAAVLGDGTLVEREERVALEAAPEAVRAAIKAKFGADAKVVVERKTVVMYEAESRASGKEVEILVLPTGRVLDVPDDDDKSDKENDDD